MKWKARCLLLGLILFSLALATPEDISAENQVWAVGSTPGMHVPEGVFVVRVYYNAVEELQLLTGFDVFEYVNPQEQYVLAAVDRFGLAGLRSLGFRAEVDAEETANYARLSLPLGAQGAEIGIESIPRYSCYRTVEETFAAAEAIVAAHPTLATWTDIGDSWEKATPGGLPGYDIRVLKLTNTAVPGPKPVLFITAAIHAREYATAELATRFAEYLVNNYGVDPDATWILDQHEVHLVLQMNPDGRKQAEAGTSWRKNTNENYCGVTSTNRGADLNRNFAFQWDCCGGSSDNPCDAAYHGAAPASEPEVQAVQNYLASLFPDQRGPNASDAAPLNATGVWIDLHSYGGQVMSPWGYTTNDPPNATQFMTFGRKLAYFNNYEPMIGSAYTVDGGTKDYGYGIYGVASYVFEIGTAFFQDCSTFESTIYPNNLPALLYAAKAARTPYMTPAGPDALSVSLSPGEVPAGSAPALTATINDTRFRQTNGTEPVQAIAAAEYYIDTPPWLDGAVAHPMAASDGSFNSTAENVTATVDTSGLAPGRHLLFVRGQDAAGNWGAFSAAFLDVTGPANQEPTAIPQAVVAGEDMPINITLTGIDPENDRLTFNVASGPNSGTLSGTAPDLTYTPAANYNGADS